ncbi:flagellar hook-associated protein FlgL [Noviherbaspirillum aridicola]|uniref:Flagellar hook-associated protein FlgL n=1 Tax=Noviherbaspirillum aridicola TaxID=2849687 RepID=A0ABQ4Q632_9BURK|nr:flagellar hook-associated protein FlgL [Noviherbaspirillum aridicola]GIZ52673.1 flagellar hook-associated protein FlgL [Noviherbaspirillum aridicola]
MTIRISTNSLFSTSSGRLSDLQARLNKMQEQISLGKRITVPSDDPVGAAQVLELTQGQSINNQFAVNRNNAKAALELEEHMLQGVTTLIQNAQTLVVSAGNGSLLDQERGFIATELEGHLADLFGLANSRDGEGNYIFGGYKVNDPPFVKTPTGARYDGDQGQRQLQVGPMRNLEINDAGNRVFEDMRTGTGLLTTSAAAGNRGTGIISNAAIKGSLTTDTYTIAFTSATQYTIQRNGDPASPPIDYVSGQSISVGPYELTITGMPATDDVFRLEPSPKQDLFKTMTDLIELLKRPATSDADKARLANGLNMAGNNLANALDNVLTVRAGVGARLKEVDALDTQGEERDTLYAKSLQTLQDLDYTKAISDLSKQQIILEAAQQSFVKTSGLSLFNYMS